MRLKEEPTGQVLPAVTNDFLFHDPDLGNNSLRPGQKGVQQWRSDEWLWERWIKNKEKERLTAAAHDRDFSFQMHSRDPAAAHEG